MLGSLALGLIVQRAGPHGCCTHGCGTARARGQLHAARMAEETPDEARRRLEIQRLEQCLSVARLEERAEQAQAENDLVGAITAYEELLALQPPESPSLRAQDASRRALQQLLLADLRRELEACESDEECELSPLEEGMQRAQRLGEEYRKFAAERSLADLGVVRKSVISLLELTESQAREAADRARGEQSTARLVNGEPGWLAGFQLAEAQKRMADARLLRKSVEADLNRLELQVLQGDPSLAFIRDVLKSTRNEPLLAEVEASSLWLKEQLDSGALPRDPELLRTLLAQARNDPEMVVRLVTQAKDRKGRDIYGRFENDVSQFVDP